MISVFVIHAIDRCTLAERAQVEGALPRTHHISLPTCGDEFLGGDVVKALAIASGNGDSLSSQFHDLLASIIIAQGERSTELVTCGGCKVHGNHLALARLKAERSVLGGNAERLIHIGANDDCIEAGILHGHLLSKNRLAHQGGAEVDALGARAERILLCLDGLEGNLHLRQERLCALLIIITCATGSRNAIPFTTLIVSIDGHIGVDEQVSSLISIGGVERDCHHLFAKLEHIARKAQGGSGAIARKFATAGNGRGIGLAQTHLHSGVQRFSKCLAHVECEGGDVTTCLKACVSQVVGGIYHLRLSAVCVHV